MAKVKAEFPLLDVERMVLRRIVDGAEDSECSTRIKAGEHSFGFTIKVEGSLKKGEDFEQVHAPSLPKMAIIENLLSRLNGVTIETVVRDVMEKGQFDREEVEGTLEARAATAWKAIAGTQKKRMNGKVALTALKVEVV